MSLAISPISERNENVAMDLLSKSESQSPTEEKKAVKSSHRKSKSKSSSPTSIVSSTSSVLLNGFRIRLLLVSGKRHDFIFEKKTTILDLKSQVFLHWPQGKIDLQWDKPSTRSLVLFISPPFSPVFLFSLEWKHENKGSSPEDLRILYHGKFLDDQLMLDSKLFTT